MAKAFMIWNISKKKTTNGNNNFTLNFSIVKTAEQRNS